MSLRESLLAAPDTERKEVQAWGASVFVGSMSAADLIAISDSKEDMQQFVGRVLVRSLFDAEGKRIFGDEDVPLVLAKDHRTVKRLFDLASVVNGLDPKKAEKNSDASPA